MIDAYQSENPFEDKSAVNSTHPDTQMTTQPSNEQDKNLTQPNASENNDATADQTINDHLMNTNQNMQTANGTANVTNIHTAENKKTINNRQTHAHHKSFKTKWNEKIGHPFKEKVAEPCNKKVFQPTKQFFKKLFHPHHKD